MDILMQCQKWHEENKHHKIIEVLEAVSSEERTMEMDMELARAYNNLGIAGALPDRKMLQKALELMKAHEEKLGNTYSWNFRMGYAYYYLDQEGRALKYFEKAWELHPGDDPKLNTKQDIEELMDDCKVGIALPQFSACFRERTEMWWKTFTELEAELRQIMDEDKGIVRGEELVANIEKTLNLFFDEISFELGFNGKKYELILTPEGNKVKLFKLVYIQKHAPQDILEHWNILVGRQPIQHIGLRTNDGWDISGEDVQIWLEKQGENSFAISAYCEKLLPMFQNEEDKVWWILTTLIDQVLGEISHMWYIDAFDVLEEPKAEPSMLMSQLPEVLKGQGLELSTDPTAYLESYMGYEMKPNEDPDADWRLDVIAGTTNCAALINEYFSNENDFIDNLHADGAVAGFFCYPMDTLREEEGTEKIFTFRDKLEIVLTASDGPDVLTLTGGATGLYCGYVDFIAWDIHKTLQMAKDFFANSDIPWASFHTFRREAGTVSLKMSLADVWNDKNQDAEGDETLTGMDYISYNPQNEEAFFEQLKQWNDKDKYTRCIQSLEAIPEEWRNYRISYAMARALQNFAIIGDDDKGTEIEIADKALIKSLEILESVRDEGKDKAEWNMRMAYGYQYLSGQEEKAIPYALRWAELDPDDENALLVVKECKEEIENRNKIILKQVEIDKLAVEEIESILQENHIENGEDYYGKSDEERAVILENIKTVQEKYGLDDEYIEDILVEFLVECEEMDENWGLYFCKWFDKQPAAVRVNLDLTDFKATDKYSKRIQLSVMLQHPDENGFPTEKEEETLYKIEELIGSIIEEKQGILVAYVKWDKRLSIFAYVENEAGYEEAFSVALEENFPDYEYKFWADEDEAWDTYFNILYPDKYEYQSITNNRIIHQVKMLGDTLVPRVLEHCLYFKTKEKREEFLEKVLQDGFIEIDEGSDEDIDIDLSLEYPYKIVVGREDKFNDIDTVVWNLIDLAKELDGEYDGWGCCAVKDERKDYE